MVHFFKKKFVAQWNQQLPLEQCPAEAAQNDQELNFFRLIFTRPNLAEMQVTMRKSLY
jgi:hypothetical protein